MVKKTGHPLLWTWSRPPGPAPPACGLLSMCHKAGWSVALLGMERQRVRVCARACARV